MPRIARVVVPGCPHHVTQRGNRREDVFFADEDRRVYLSLLGQYAVKHGLAVQAYCLMTDHVHLVVVPKTSRSLSGALKPLHTRYTQHVNRRAAVSGRLWQGRFYSCPLDEQHVWTAVRYVERNPVRAGMVTKACGNRGASPFSHFRRGSRRVAPQGPARNSLILFWTPTTERREKYFRSKCGLTRDSTSRLRRQVS
jgi:putative transposase